jgi:hypothetical protein
MIKRNVQIWHTLIFVIALEEACNTQPAAPLIWWRRIRWEELPLCDCKCRGDRLIYIY